MVLASSAAKLKIGEQARVELKMHNLTLQPTAYGGGCILTLTGLLCVDLRLSSPAETCQLQS
jgi:hypothetical protein